MIGIISLFTGMIAPLVANGNMAYPLPLTDMQTFAYIILFLLSVGFYLVSVRRWGLFRIIGLILLIILGYISSIAFSGWVHTLQDWLSLIQIRWGWVFVGVGVVSILYTIMAESTEKDSEVSLFSDAIIGIVGTITLLWLSALIIGASMWGVWGHNSGSVLEKVFATGTLRTSSGITQTQAYSNIAWLTFDRKDDAISFVVQSSSGGTIQPTGIWYPGSDMRSEVIAGRDTVMSSSGIWLDGVRLWSDERIHKMDDTLVIENDIETKVVTRKNTRSYVDAKMIMTEVVTSADGSTTSWVAKSGSGYEIQKDGKSISDTYASISGLGISQSGHETLALARTLSGELIVLKNGVPVENIRAGYRTGSWKNNGSHSIYITLENDIQRVIYDGVSTGKEFGEVREVFLERWGNSYAFFARPIDESGYCIFTRFRGNLCSITGYMNPRLSADGSSIIYAGLRDGIWSIYRNTDTIVRDTGYTHIDISNDYVFFDITNPKQYVFLENNDGKYQVRKNWKIILWIWNDVGLDVSFGYDNKVIMSAQDDAGWRVIEF
jgi:hypothetical protein